MNENDLADMFYYVPSVTREFGGPLPTKCASWIWARVADRHGVMRKWSDVVYTAVNGEEPE